MSNCHGYSLSAVVYSWWSKIPDSCRERIHESTSSRPVFSSSSMSFCPSGKNSEEVNHTCTTNTSWSLICHTWALTSWPFPITCSLSIQAEIELNWLFGWPCYPACCLFCVRTDCQLFQGQCGVICQGIKGYTSSLRHKINLSTGAAPIRPESRMLNWDSSPLDTYESDADWMCWVKVDLSKHTRTATMNL